ncbi:MAG: ABC transporter substrate binding protein [Pseudomonadota bacterium]
MGIKIIFPPLLIKLLLLVWLALYPLSLLADQSKSILIFSAYGEKFYQTYQGIKDDLGDDFKIIGKIIEPETAIDNIKNYIDNIKPTLIVLIGNTPARLYTNYQKQYAQRTFPPSVVMSALYVDRLLQQMKNTQGIRHEIPAVTSISYLRLLVKQPMKRVGVLYRKWMRDYIKLNSEYCQKEGIELVTVEIPNKSSVKNLNYHIRHLLNKNIDALWVVNDNALISSNLIQNVWLPNIQEFNKPVIVGVEGLTVSSLDFGTFAVVPDQYALGIQGAGLIGDILDEGIKQFSQNKIYEPISVKKMLNIHLMQRRNITIDESKLESLDQLIR